MKDERGVTIVFMALLMVALLGMAGLVVNLGLVRADRQRNKSVSDVAVTAGLQGLNLDGQIAPFRGACAALEYLKANHNELSSLSLATGWTDGSDPAVALAGNPCDSSGPAYANYDNLCDNSDLTTARSTFAWFSGSTPDGAVEVKVRAGYDSARMTTDGFGDEAYHTDTGAPAQNGCDQLAVMVTEKEDGGFGRVVGVDELSSSIRSVGRVTVDTDVQATIALLLLEREDCGVLTFSGTNSAVRVKGNGDRPGIIHADSIGNGDGCSAKILDGNAASTPDGYTGPSILADAADVGSPAASGKVSVAALAGISGSVPGRASTACPSTVLAAPSSCVTGSGRKGRGNVDVLYRQRMINMRAEAVSWTTSAPPGFTTIGCPSGVVATQKVFVNCSNMNNAAKFTATDAEVIFNGRISGSNNITFDNPAKIYVKDGISRSGGVFSVNAGVSPDCTSRFGTDRSKTTKIVVVNGELSGAGSASYRMCGTTVLLGDGNSTGSPCGLPAIPTTNNMEPYDNCFDGVLSLSGGGTFDWTAPNASDNAMSSTDPADTAYLDDFEDLALWTETSATSQLSGGGTNVMKGVFFLPNANPFTINGGASQAIERDAQFIIRKLRLTGNGSLTMRPNPNNSIAFPYFSSYDLVR